MAEPLPSKQKTRVRFSPSAPYRHVRLAAEDPGPSNRVARVRIPHVAPIVLPLRLAGRAPGFELGGLGSNPRGVATSTWVYNVRKRAPKRLARLNGEGRRRERRRGGGLRPRDAAPGSARDLDRS